MRPRERTGWKTLIVGTLFALVSASCTAQQATVPPVLQTTVHVTTTAGPTAAETTSTTTLAPTTTSSTLSIPMEVDALITPSGVIVAVLEPLPRGFLVLTPCGNEVVVVSGRPVESPNVVIDPGHGGEPDPGAVGPNGLKEAAINLRVARQAEIILENRGFSVALTRTADYTSPLGVRTAFADLLGPEIMVSIHHNAPTANLGSEPGTEVFVQYARADSRRLGELIYSYVTDALGGFDGIEWSTAPDAGAIEVLNTRGTDAYGMLRTPKTVTVLAELAYISNASEADLLMTSSYVIAASTALADAVEAYLTSDDDGVGYVATPRVFNPQSGISASVCQDPDFG